jgi:two-component system chemotaxis sensor kinase CheA
MGPPAPKPSPHRSSPHEADDLDDCSFVADALPAFMSEAQEQIASIEQLLLQLEDAPDDRELLDALFRCAHTVKGSAGIFGLDAVVAFTHHVESLLDRLRAGAQAAHAGAEHAAAAVQRPDPCAGGCRRPAGDDAPTTPGDAARAALVARLQGGGRRRPRRAPAQQDAAARLPSPTPPAAGRSARTSAPRPSATAWTRWPSCATWPAGHGAPGAVRHRRRAGAGSWTRDLPPGLRFLLDTGATRRQIEAAFSFVRDDCQLSDAAATQAVRRSRPCPTSHRWASWSTSAAISAHQLQHTLPQQRPPPMPCPAWASCWWPTACPQVQTALQKQARQRGTGTPAPADDNRFIRVQADRLDAVINLLGELVIAGAGAQLLARQTRQRNLIEANQQIGRLIEEIRNGTLQLRMVPIGETFSRFQRVVRDTAAELGKDVALEIRAATPSWTSRWSSASPTR